MPALSMLPAAHVRGTEPFFPTLRRLRRVDDRQVISGVVHVLQRGLQWQDAPRGDGPHKTLYNRLVRWSRLRRVRPHRRGAGGPGWHSERLMIDSTHPEAHRTATIGRSTDIVIGSRTPSADPTDCRRIATLSDRCAHTSRSAITIVARVIVRLT